MPALSARLISVVHQIARAETRLPALWPTRLRVGDAEMKVTLRNVSASGFMAVASTQIQAGSEVTLVLPVGAPRTADVRWSLNARLGCRLRGRFDRRQRAFLALCGLANGLFSGTALKVFLALAALAVVSFA